MLSKDHLKVDRQYPGNPQNSNSQRQGAKPLENHKNGNIKPYEDRYKQPSGINVDM